MSTLTNAERLAAMTADFDTALGAAKDTPAFSNSDGYAWLDHWCGDCIHDRGARDEDGDGAGCPLVLIALSGRTPNEWTLPKDAPDWSSNYECSMYEEEPGPVAEVEGAAERLVPVPVLPGQVALFDEATDGAP